ncbi:DUF5104 domain-containing protein [Clostridium saccharoperbutylacetonicum]|uniref:DUF5104 domain-containing protein n=1 Tax=Clostridium saccharoperbutylacetonicum TaxID=36745 RepID=UPI0039E76187
MKIKRLIIIIIFSLGLLSCNSMKTMINDCNEDEKADIQFQRIIKVLENKDKDGVKKFFSQQALKEANDIDGGIDYIMDFYKGEMKSSKRTVARLDSVNYGDKKSELDCRYIVTTNEDTYIVFFIDQIVDTKNLDNVGIYMLQVIKESDKEKEFDGGGKKTRCAGIYRTNTTNLKIN